MGLQHPRTLHLYLTIRPHHGLEHSQSLFSIRFFTHSSAMSPSTSFLQTPSHFHQVTFLCENLLKTFVHNFRSFLFFLIHFSSEFQFAIIPLYSVLPLTYLKKSGLLFMTFLSMFFSASVRIRL